MRKQESLKKGVEGIDYVIDKWNGYATPRIYGKWMASMHPGKTTEDYLSEFPGAPLYCQNDHKATFKNSGKHMKDPKYRKMASEAIKGTKNPNHKSRVNKEVRQSRSPFSTKFSGYSTQEEARKFQKEHCNKGIGSNKIEYWLNQGYDEKEAEGLLRERQATFTLEKCIQKWGEEKGTQRFNERQEKWLKSFTKLNYSKASQDLFIQLYNKVKDKFNDIYFATLNNGEILNYNNGRNYEYTLKLKNRTVKPDFFIKDNNKIIEFDGIYWHRNNPENKKRELIRDQAITNSGYQILHITESEWYQSPEETLKKCIEFLHD
jgi:hypothetical protein